MGIRQQIKSIIKENIKNRYLITPERYGEELHDLSNELFNLGKINEYEIDAEDLLDILPDLMEYYVDKYNLGQSILDCLKDRNYTTLYDLYGFMIFNEIAEELIDETKTDIDNMEKDFTELFNTTSETIYFRNSEIDNGLTERFNDNENNHIIAYINTEDIGNTNLDYNTGSSEEFIKLMLKYNLMFEWENECIASLSFDEQIE